MKIKWCQSRLFTRNQLCTHVVPTLQVVLGPVVHPVVYGNGVVERGPHNWTVAGGSKLITESKITLRLLSNAQRAFTRLVLPVQSLQCRFAHHTRRSRPQSWKPWYPDAASPDSAKTKCDRMSSVPPSTHPGAEVWKAWEVEMKQFFLSSRGNHTVDWAWPFGSGPNLRPASPEWSPCVRWPRPDCTSSGTRARHCSPNTPLPRAQASSCKKIK